MAITAADLVVKMSADTKNAEAGMQRMSKGISGFAKSAAAIGTGILSAQVFRRVARGFDQATATALDFGRSMANVNSILQVSDNQIAKAGEDLQQMALRTAQAPGVLAAGLYQVVSSGFSDLAEAEKILEISANGATAGLTTTDVAARAVTGTLNAYGQGIADAQRVQDVFFQTVNDGVLSYEELANNLGKTTSQAANLNIPIEQLGAAYAQMTLNNVDAAQSETQLAALFQAAVNPTEAMSKAILAYGYDTAESLIKAKGLPGFLKFLDDTAGGSATSLNELLGNQTAANAAMILGKNDVKNYIKEIDRMNHATDKGGATHRALEKQMKSASFQVQRMKVAMQVLAIQGFGIIAPVVTRAAMAMTRFISRTLVPFASIIGRATKANFAFGKGFDKLLQQIPQPLRRTVHAIASFTDALSDMWRRGFSANEMRQALHAIQAIGEELGQAMHFVANIAIDLVTSFSGWLWDHAGDIWGGIKSLIGWGAGAFSDVITATITGAIHLGGDLLDAAGDIYGWIKKKLFAGPTGDATGGPDPYAQTLNEISFGTVTVAAAVALGGQIAAVAGRLGEWVKGQLFGGPGSVSQDPASPMAGQAGLSIDLGTAVLNVTNVVAHAAQSAIDAASEGIKAALGNIQVVPDWSLVIGPPQSYDFQGGWESADVRASAIEEKLQQAGDAVAHMRWKLLLLAPIPFNPVLVAAVVAGIIQEQVLTRVPIINYAFKLAAGFILTAANLAQDAYNKVREKIGDIPDINLPVNLDVDLNINVIQHVKSGAEGIWEFLTGSITPLSAGGVPGGMSIQAPQDLDITSTFSVSANLDMAQWDANIDQIKSDTDTYNNTWFFSFFGIDTAQAAKAFTDAGTWGETWANATYTSTFDIDNGPAAVKFTNAENLGILWENSTFTSAFDISLALVAQASASAWGIGNAWAGSVFTASFAIDTSGLWNALAVAQIVAANISAIMPHSPAKKGPLSKPISFGFIADAARRDLSGLGSSIEGYLGMRGNRRPLARAHGGGGLHIHGGIHITESSDAGATGRAVAKELRAMGGL